MTACAVVDCGRPRRAHELCAKHGVAKRKYGDPLGESTRNRHAGERFGAWTLVERVTGQGWLCRCDCGTERVVWLSSVTSGRSKSCGGPAHPRHGNTTRKAVPSYVAMHRRLRVDLGRASEQDCIDCGQRACDWSYDGGDPDAQTGVSWLGKPITYSLKPEHYVPRCRPCHQRHDIQQRTLA